MEKQKKNRFEYEVTTSEVDGLTFIKVKAVKGYFHVTFCDLGASIYDVFFLQRRMTLTPKFTSDFKRVNVYHGKTIGRVASRIKDAKIEVDGITYNLDPNEPPHTLHGGKCGISSRFFEHEVIEDDEALTILFKYFSPHLDAGFPEDVQFYVRYVFPKETAIPSFYVVFDALSERTTPIKLTNHTYWNLGESSIRTMQLEMNTERFVKVDPEDFILKDICKINRKDLFRNEHLFYIMKDEQFKDGLDNYFYFKANKKYPNYPQIVISNSHSAMAVFTDFPGAVLYTDNFEDGVNYFHTKTRKWRALAIEPCLEPADKGMIDQTHPFHHYINFQFFSMMK